MSSSIERQKLEDRVELSFDEKLDLSKKSNDCCCHCGRKVFWGIPSNRATIEHFIPLSQGGTNRNINLIMLCEDCNFEKGEKILEPDSYLKYLNEPYKTQLNEYFQSYISSFDFFKRRNVLALDTYDFTLTTEGYGKGYHSSIGSGVIKIPVTVSRVMVDDIDEVSEYFIRYLKSVDSLDDPVSARHNIEFWFRFGCMYCVRGSTGEIIDLAVICLNKHPKVFNEETGVSVDHSFNIFIFPKYNNFKGFNISALLCYRLPEVIAREQKLEFVPIRVFAIRGEKFLPKFAMYSKCDLVNAGSFVAIQYIKRMQYSVPMDDSQITQVSTKISEFISKFDVIEEEMDNYIKSTGYTDITWMKDLIISPEYDDSID